MLKYRSLSLAALKFNAHYSERKTAFPRIERSKHFHEKLNYVLSIRKSQTVSQRLVKDQYICLTNWMLCTEF